MPTTAPDNRLNVAVGILRNDQGDVLVQQRMPGKPCEGQWEFPGGKIEQGESAEQALTRELAEELGVRVIHFERLINLPFDYSHAKVWLQTFQIVRYEGEVSGREGQQFLWKPVTLLPQLDLLDAVFPILDALDPAS